MTGKADTAAWAAHSRGGAVAALMRTTGAERGDAENALITAEGKAGEKGGAYAYRAARNALISMGRAWSNHRKREVRIDSEACPGKTYADTLADPSCALRAEWAEREEELAFLLRACGRRAAELAMMCVRVADEAGAGARVSKIQVMLRERWFAAYPQADERTYFRDCEKVRLCLRCVDRSERAASEAVFG